MKPRRSSLIPGVARAARLASPTITGHPYLSPYEDLQLKGR
jgi:hypothetical protein